MKVFVQIPCLNEEETLPLVLAGIPKAVAGVDEIEVLVIDDGCTDRTVDVARSLGVRHVVMHTRTMGLARSFRDGVDYALAHGADIVVNTDGDNQYPQERIPDLLAPILAGDADIVIGDRQTRTVAHFSRTKKLMQRFGSFVVSKAASTHLPDAASGFRAYSRPALRRLNVITDFSYCMDTIIQAGHRRLRIVSIPVVTNPKTRESRLFSSDWHHVSASAAAIVRSYLMFRPFVLFASLGALLTVLGVAPFVRYAVLWLTSTHLGDHLQSLIIGTVLLVAALLAFALGVLSDLQRTNRRLLEETLERIKTLQYPDRDTSWAQVRPASTSPDDEVAAGERRVEAHGRVDHVEADPVAARRDRA